MSSLAFWVGVKVPLRSKPRAWATAKVVSDKVGGDAGGE